MKAEVKKKWVEALRGGEYRQARGKLRNRRFDETSYCCLGVLCDLHSKETNTPWHDDRYITALNYLPPHVILWAGLSSNGDMVDIPDKCSLAYMNDIKKATFVEIADVIEESL